MQPVGRRHAVCILALCVLAALLTAVGGVTPASRAHAAVAPCTVDPLLVNSCRPWFGTTANGYPAPVGSDKLSQMQHAEQRAGRQVDVAHTYHAAGDTALSPTDLYYANRPGTMLFTNWKPTENWSLGDGSDAGVNGQIDQMAASIRSLGDTRIFLTVFHEPENDLTVPPAGCTGLTVKGTAGTALQYQAMWANVRARFDAAGVDNVVWVMDYMNYAPYNCIVDAVYPGDDLVDWVVFNAYQHNDSNVSFSANVSNMYNLLTANSSTSHDYLSKPWGIVEWGINKSTQASAYAYYASAQQTVEAGTFPKLKLFMNFDNTDFATGDGSYRVRFGADGLADQAEQDAFNRFANSPALSGTWTFADVVAPTAPTGVSGALANGVPRLSWSAATDDVAVASYTVLRDGTAVGTTSDVSWTDQGATEGRSYQYTVRAVDGAGNSSEDSAPVVVTVPAPADTTAPTAPTGLAASLSNGQPRLTWSAASDNVGVAAYDVLRAGVVVASTTSRIYTDTTAPQGRSSTYTVRARDARGNTGPASTPVTIAVPDRTAPTAVTGLAATRSRTSVRLTWGRASDNVAVTRYYVYRGTTRVQTLASTSTTATVNGLSSGSRYTFRVAAVDAAGNVGPAVPVTA